MIRVLLVEDSITQREIFCRLLQGDSELSVIAEARNGQEAIEKVKRYSPDVVLMDIHMPDMDGIAATAEIMRQCPVPIVVASATLKKRDVDLAMKAYEAGAVSVIEKPEGAVLLHLQKIAPELRRELISASKVQLKRGATKSGLLGQSSLSSLATAIRNLRSHQFKVIGVCASTGGPPILQELLNSLPRPFKVPILLVQHISQGFEDGFARWLTTSTDHQVAIAKQGQRLTEGIWLAPGGHHLTVAGKACIELTSGSETDVHRPSGNPLFASIAKHFGPEAIGIQLTGMGADGASGLLSLREAGGVTIVQAERSCMIWGMPKVAKEIGGAMYEMDPREIAKVLSVLQT